MTENPREYFYKDEKYIFFLEIDANTRIHEYTSICDGYEYTSICDGYEYTSIC